MTAPPMANLQLLPRPRLQLHRKDALRGSGARLGAGDQPEFGRPVAALRPALVNLHPPGRLAQLRPRRPCSACHRRVATGGQPDRRHASARG